MTDDYLKVFAMATKENLKNIGTKVRHAREQLKLSQAELGAQLWPKLKKSASQSRVFRIEEGTYKLDYNAAHRLFDMLGIHDVDAETLKTKTSSEPLCLHRKLGVRHPELHHYFALINAATMANRFDEVAKLVTLMSAIFRDEIENTKPADPADPEMHQHGDLDPFAKGEQG